MQVHLSEIAKRYHRWVFRDVNYTFESGKSYGIAGRNGSGKSTLLAIISGYATPSNGSVQYQNDRGRKLGHNEVFDMINIATPYVSLIGELTLDEHLNFHTKFRPLGSNINRQSFFQLSNLEGYKDVLVDHLSSGLQQRYKLALALLTEHKLLLLDEPSSYLDQPGREWFAKLILASKRVQTTILASNDPEDLNLVDVILRMDDYSPG